MPDLRRVALARLQRTASRSSASRHQPLERVPMTHRVIPRQGGGRNGSSAFQTQRGFGIAARGTVDEMEMAAVHGGRETGDERAGLQVHSVARDAASCGILEELAYFVREALGAIDRHPQRVVVLAEIRILHELAIIGDRGEAPDFDAEAKD